jgi:hypothetical protein
MNENPKPVPRLTDIFERADEPLYEAQASLSGAPVARIAPPLEDEPRYRLHDDDIESLERIVVMCDLFRELIPAGAGSRVFEIHEDSLYEMVRMVQSGVSQVLNRAAGRDLDTYLPRRG